MSPQKAFHRLHDMVAQDLAQLAPNTILPDGRGYLMFEIYSVQPRNQIWLIYKRGNLVTTMTGLKSAVSWCVADKYQQYQLSTEIISLDQQKMLLESDIITRETLSKRHLSIDKEVAAAKLAARKQRLESIDQRLAKCINVAKYWQLRGFNNETARAGRTASYRTYR